MLGVFILCIVVHSVVMLGVFILCAVTHSEFLLCVVMLSVVHLTFTYSRTVSETSSDSTFILRLVC
jgi:hypothetical protein